jgi:hypothetical protein
LALNVIHFWVFVSAIDSRFGGKDKQRHIDIWPIQWDIWNWVWDLVCSCWFGEPGSCWVGVGHIEILALPKVAGLVICAIVVSERLVFNWIRSWYECQTQRLQYSDYLENSSCVLSNQLSFVIVDCHQW